MKKYLFCTILLFYANIIVAQFPTMENYIKLSPQEMENLFKDSTIGKPAKDFNLITLNGLDTKLSKFKGKVVFINFFYIACAPCVVEIPTINRLVEKYKERNVIFLSISVRDSSVALSKIKDKYKILSDIIPVKEKISYDNSSKQIFYNMYVARHLYMTNVFPSNLVIDKKGIIKLAEVGFDLEKEEDIFKKYSDYIDACLKE